jgi:hypothetical protein
MDDVGVMATMGLATDAGGHATAPTGVKTRSHRLLLRPTRTARVRVSGQDYCTRRGRCMVGIWALRESKSTDIRNLSRGGFFWVVAQFADPFRNVGHLL